MNHCVPEFEMDENYAIPSSSGLTRPKKSLMAEDEVMELLWQNGQVVMQSQNHRSFKKSPMAADQTAPRDIRPLHQNQLQQPSVTDHLFLQEDEMASWLHYPLNDANFDNDFCADLLYSSAPCVTSTFTTTAAPPARAIQHQANYLPALASASAVASSSRPPIPPARRMELDSSKIQNFAHLSRLKPRVEPSEPSNTRMRESTVVDSCDSPAVIPESRGFQTVSRNIDYSFGVKHNNACATMGTPAATSTHSAGVSIGADASSRENLATCELTMTSSPGGSSGSAEPPAHIAASQNRKRKAIETAEGAECHAKDAEFESPDGKKQTRGSTSTKRSRAAEVHNLSERRRRDRINEKMRALQELIPRCNKSDKASMLDEAIEYLKSLQLQVQMMSMGCGMVPMMFPGIQQFMPPIGMGMGMGMEMGMNRPMMPFPNALAGSALASTAAAAHLCQRFPMPAFRMPQQPVPDPSRIQQNQSGNMLSSLGMQPPNFSQMPNFADSYQQYLSLHQGQLPPQQTQAIGQPSSSKPGTGKDTVNMENHPPRS